MDDLLNVFNILSDKTRLRILLLLLNKDLCVCEIYAALDMSQPRVSRQLAILKQSRLIKDRREGKWIYYKIDDNEYTKCLRTILSLLPDWLSDDEVYNYDKSMLQKISSNNKLSTCECILTGGENCGE